MVTEQVLFKADSAFLKEIDRAVKEGHYQNRTEFIRESLRKNIDERRARIADEIIAQIRGKAKKNVTEEEYERARQEAVEEIAAKFKFDKK